MPLPPDQFVALLTRAQPQIYGFIGRMVIDRTDADEVLQETNIALWSERARAGGLPKSLFFPRAFPDASFRSRQPGAHALNRCLQSPDATD